MTVTDPLIQVSLLGEAIENGPLAVFVADENERYIAASRAACELLGYTREELLGLSVTDVARYEEAAEEYSELLATGSGAGTTVLTCKDGSTVEFTYFAGETEVAGMQVYISVGAPT
ncbi:MAG TPA: PAS domain-containing protein [Gaiellaceae bacterium]|nr:PAS domain-containing protein [Gaiellaceae bacterium]